VLAPLSIPSSLVPVSLATFAVMLAGAILGAKEGVICTALYLLLGALGIPVFAGWSSGISILFGMTGGYLFGYLPLAWCTGKAAEKSTSFMNLVIGMVIGTVILYVIGTIWFMAYMKMGLMPSLAACVLPFLPGDALKIAAVCLIAPRLRTALKQMI
jgi:biotin transport system substrate-specific component